MGQAAAQRSDKMSSNKLLKATQQRLIKAGYNLGSSGADGRYGQYTDNAINDALDKAGLEEPEEPDSLQGLSSKYITEHFKWSEFTCKDGTEVPEKLKENAILLCKNILEPLRKEINNRYNGNNKIGITITSGYRTQSYNDKLSGTSNPQSMHIYAGAADIICKSISREELQSICLRMFNEYIIGGYGYGETCTHVDIRNLIDKTKFPYPNYRAKWTY